MAKRVNLNQRLVQGWKPTASRQEIADFGYPLFLIVQPSGEKSWQWKGKIDGKFRRKVLGRVHDVTLADARDAALALRSSLT